MTCPTPRYLSEPASWREGERGKDDGKRGECCSAAALQVLSVLFTQQCMNVQVKNENTERQRWGRHFDKVIILCEGDALDSNTAWELYQVAFDIFCSL